MEMLKPENVTSLVQNRAAAEPSITEVLDEITTSLVESLDRAKFIACNLNSNLGNEDPEVNVGGDDSILEGTKDILMIAEHIGYWLQKIEGTLY